jgi:hypothetical protein
MPGELFPIIRMYQAVGITSAKGAQRSPYPHCERRILVDLAANPGELVASCRNRHHNAVLPVVPVLARYGPTTPFLEVKVRFRCSACGSRQVDVRPNGSWHSPGKDHPPHLTPPHHVDGSHPTAGEPDQVNIVLPAAKADLKQIYGKRLSASAP